MNNFTNLQTTRMGTLGEDMVINEFILSKGYVPYRPSVEMSHPIDAVAISGTSQWFCEVKTKSRMKYRAEIGMDTNDFHLYQTYEHPVYLLIVDPSLGEVYGQWMSKIAKQPLSVWDTTTSFPLSGMTHYRYLTPQECSILKELEQSNY